MTLIEETKTRRKSKASAETGDGKAHPGRRMTETEFVAWADAKTLAEWVDGEVIVMPPVSLDHSSAGFWLQQILSEFVEHFDLGRVFGPEVIIRLPRQRRRRMPDVLFVARSRADILRRNHIEGAPDLIIELVSPESMVRDWRDKYLDYERAGVREYWVIDRFNARLEAYTLERGKYRRLEETDGKILSTVLKGFYLRPRWLLGAALASRRAALREMGVKG